MLLIYAGLWGQGRGGQSSESPERQPLALGREGWGSQPSAELPPLPQRAPNAKGTTSQQQRVPGLWPGGASRTPALCLQTAGFGSRNWGCGMRGQPSPGHPGSSGWRKNLQGPPSLANPSRAPHARGSPLSSSANAAWPERGLSCHRDGMLATPDGPGLRGAFTCRVERVWLPRGRGTLGEGHRGCLEGRIVSEGLGGMGEGEPQVHNDKDPSSWTPSFRIVCGTWQGLLERRRTAPSYPHPEPGARRVLDSTF